MGQYNLGIYSIEYIQGGDIYGKIDDRLVFGQVRYYAL